MAPDPAFRVDGDSDSDSEEPSFEPVLFAEGPEPYNVLGNRKSSATYMEERLIIRALRRYAKMSLKDIARVLHLTQRQVSYALLYSDIRLHYDRTGRIPLIPTSVKELLRSYINTPRKTK